MSIGVMKLVWATPSTEDSPLASSVDRFTLLALADNSDDFGFAFPFHTTVCKKTGLSLPAVKRSIRKADKNGLLWRAGRDRDNGSATSSVYRFNLDALSELSGESAPDFNWSEFRDHPLLSHFAEDVRQGWGL